MRRIVALLASLAVATAAEVHQAARNCTTERMRQVLAQHPPLNEPDENGFLPLHIAIDARQKACVWMLLEAGADRKALDRQGRTPFDAAAKIADADDRSRIEYMLRNFGTPSSRPQPGPAPWSLEYSAKHGQPGVTKMLLSLGADPNTVGTGGTTPLAEAALKGDLESVRALLARGAKSGAVSRIGTQPIHDAALADHPEVIRELVKQGAEVNARTRDEAQTPLHVASAMGRTKAVEALVALGADLSLKDAQGRTPLETAERAGFPEIVAILKRPAPVK